MQKNKSDYLKYYKVIKQFYRVKHKLYDGQIDVLLFLYTEGYFTKSKFEEFNRLLPFNGNRFTWMLRDGWLLKIKDGVAHKGSAKYHLAVKGVNLVESMYRKLDGEEIPTEPKYNPMYMRNVSNTNKRYRKMIENMTAYIREQKRDKALDLSLVYDY